MINEGHGGFWEYDGASVRGAFQTPRSNWSIAVVVAGPLTPYVEFSILGYECTFLHLCTFELEDERCGEGFLLTTALKKIIQGLR